MKPITHGIIVIDPLSEDENGDVSIVHYIGYWNKPSQADFDSLKEELRTDEEFGLTEIFDRLEYGEAPEEILEMLNNDLIEDLEDE